MWDFEHPPLAATLAERYQLHYTLPSLCADELLAARADLGLIPIASLTPDLAIVPNCVIASLNHVRSIQLIVRSDASDPDIALRSVRSIAADKASRSSLVYADILFRKFLSVQPTFVPCEADPIAMLKLADAAVLIGDPALVALDIRPQLEDAIGPCHWFDLAHEWRTRTGLPWVAPSPNMPTPDTARVYPGGCLIEGTNLSEGRGTTRPFELIGAPFLDGRRLARALSRRQLPGVMFRAAGFEPAFHKFKGRHCQGVQLHVTDVRRFKPFATYLALIAEARRTAARHFRWKRPPYEFERRRLPIDLLCGGEAIRRAIERDVPLSHLERSWRPALARFARARRPHLLYS